MNTPENPHRARMALLLAGVLSAWPAFAQTTYYWDGNGTTAGAGATASNNGNWGGASASAFWGTVANGTGATTAAAITSADTVVFTANDGVAGNNPTGGYTVTLGAAQSVYGIVLGNSALPTGGGTLTLTGTGSPGISIGAGGVVMNGSTGDTTFHANLGTITLTADQTWTVNPAKVWNVNSAVAGNATAGNTRIWTLGYVNAFTNAYAGVISDGSAGGKLGITVNNVNGAGTATGGGTQYISGTANTYTGKTTIARGLLQVRALANAGTASSLGAATGADGIIDMGSGTNSATLQYNGAAATSTNRVINLAGTTGGATLTNNSGTGITAGFTGGVTNAGGGNKTLTLNGSNTGNNTVGAISDAADLSKTAVAKSGAGTWVLTGDNTFTGGLSLTGGTLTFSGAVNHFDGAITVNSSTGILNFNGANNFTQGMTVTSGTVILGASGSLGLDVVGNNIVVNGGNLQFNADSGFTGVNRSITINSGGIGIGAGGVLPAFIDNTINGVVLGLNLVGDAGITGLTGKSFLGSFTGGTFTGASLTAGDNATYRLGGGGGHIVIQNSVLTGANNLLVGSTGGGIVTLANANTYTGTTTVQNGTLNVSSLNRVSGGTASSSLGAAPMDATTGKITLGSGANNVVLNYTGSGETTDRILDFAGTTGSVTLGNSGTGAINYESAPVFSGNGNKTLILGNTTDAQGGSIGGIVNSTGTTSLTKQGLTNSTWTLTGTTGATGSNTYTGTTTITGGVLSVTGTTADPLANSYLVLAGTGTSNYAVFQGNGTIARTLSGTAAASNLNWAGNGGFAAKGGTLTITLNGGADLVWATGSFQSTGGTPMVFGSSTADSEVVFTNNINLNTTDAFSRVIHVEKGTGGDRARLTGVLSPGTGPTGLTKTGAGTLILAGNNTYTGITMVSAGTLLVNGNQTVATGATTVNSGATFGGAGIIGGATTVNAGAFLTPGAVETGAGVLTFNNGLAMNGTATLQVLSAGGARGTDYDGINIAAGSFTGTGALVLNFSTLLGDTATLDLFSGAAFTTTPGFSSVTATGLYTGTFGLSGGVYTLVSGGQTLTFTAATGDLVVTGSSAVPEPATYAALAGGLVLAGAMGARRRTVRR